MISIRAKEQQILVKIERKVEALRKANSTWSYEKSYCEVIHANPALLAEYLKIRDLAKAQGLRPILRERKQD
jgi:hypothetical protein